MLALPSQVISWLAFQKASRSQEIYLAARLVSQKQEIVSLTLSLSDMLLTMLTTAHCGYAIKT